MNNTDISLIGNSGIQFHKFDIVIDPNREVIKTMGFYEFLDQINDTITLQYACFLPDYDIWIPKKILKVHDNLDEDDRLKDNLNFQLLKGFRLSEDREYYTVSDISSCLDLYLSQGNDNKWLPVPFFKKNSNQRSVFGPIAWARMMIRATEPAGSGAPKDRRSAARTYKIILAFDTKTDGQTDGIYYAPSEEDTSNDDNTFALCNNENLTLSFCDESYHGEWVDRYLKSVAVKALGRDTMEFPRLKYLACYLYMIKYLEKLGEFPEVEFLPDKLPPGRLPIEVDLVLDIGNSNTCGVLFESPGDNRPFQFNSVKELKLNDLSDPTKDYDKPFSMRLAFMETKFGDMDIPGYKNFRWPSLLRLGPEAARLINGQKLNNNHDAETVTNHSSPKRYLWDEAKADVQWEFINFQGRDLRDAIYFEGISEQFKENGDYAYDGDFACTPYYSRRSLMTFVYIEILLHAIAQVNSHEFRSWSKNPQWPRQLKRITVTCPTSIIQKEQVALRESAVVAVRTLERFFSDTFLAQYDEKEEKQNSLVIIPRPADLSKNLDQIAFRTDWIYDEATCGQLVFLYAEISKRYLNNAGLFFELYGKRRDDVANKDKKSLTIGSIDIGGGTTDLMICSYQYEEGQSLAVLKPQPLYWESMTLAGDDLMKEIIQQILLEGSPSSPEEEGCTGVIANAARKMGVPAVVDKMLHFFGTNTNRQGFMTTIYRKNFIVQVAIPIAQRYLEHGIQNLPDTEVSFDQLFPENRPNKELLEWFNAEFRPLRFEDIRWKLSKDRVSSIVETTFDRMFRQLSAILAAYGCDFVLLAGRPTTIPRIREMFIKYYPVSPDRIITLNGYRVGRWYPFADERGFMEDPKTIVAVGACIALMADKLKRLEGFELRTQLLRQMLISTSDYMGLINPYTRYIGPLYLSPENNTCDIEVHTLPLKIGYKQLPNDSYHGRPIYKLAFNDKEIRRRVMEQDPMLVNERDIVIATDNFRNSLMNNMPFSVRLQRNIRESKERVTVERVVDTNRNERSRHLLALNVMTLPDEYGYWLDTGEFSLNIK